MFHLCASVFGSTPECHAQISLLTSALHIRSCLAAGLAGALPQCGDAPQVYNIQPAGALYCLPRASATVGTSQLTLPRATPAGPFGSHSTFVGCSGYMQPMMPPHTAVGTAYPGAYLGSYWQPLTPGGPRQPQESSQRGDCTLYTVPNPIAAHAQQGQQQGVQKGPPIQQMQQYQYTSTDGPRGAPAEAAVSVDVEGTK